MGVLGRYGTNALKYWGDILTSAYQRANTQEMWLAIRTAQERYGLDRPGTTPPDVSTLRGFANRIVAGAAALAAAAPTDTITPDMMAVAPYTSNTLEGIATNPTYHVRYLNTVQASDGTTTSVWNTSVFTAADMPTTVGDLQDAINTHAAELAAQGIEASATTPRGVSVSTSDYEITLV